MATLRTKIGSQSRQDVQGRQKRRQVPGIVASAGRSEFREELNADNNMFQRFEARAFWAIRLGQILLNPDLRYFRSLDLAPVLKENGLDEGFHSAISLGYVFEERESGPLQFFEYIYLHYNRGQFPVYLDNRETVEAGISFRF